MTRVREKKFRPGSQKRKKTANLPIHQTKIIQPGAEIPPGSEFKGYQDYTVQELIIKPHNIRSTPSHLENAKGRVPQGAVTSPGERERALWSD